MRLEGRKASGWASLCQLISSLIGGAMKKKDNHFQVKGEKRRALYILYKKMWINKCALEIGIRNKVCLRKCCRDLGLRG